MQHTHMKAFVPSLSEALYGHLCRHALGLGPEDTADQPLTTTQQLRLLVADWLAHLGCATLGAVEIIDIVRRFGPELDKVIQPEAQQPLMTLLLADMTLISYQVSATYAPAQIADQLLRSPWYAFGRGVEGHLQCAPVTLIICQVNALWHRFQVRAAAQAALPEKFAREACHAPAQPDPGHVDR